MAALGALVLCVSAGPATAQDRSPASRQTLVDLANVLGQSHAIRQACTHGKDFSWFHKMERLLQVEAAEESLKGRLVTSFNTGYAAGQAGFPTCSKATRAAEARLAQRGQSLAGQLGQP